jgi:hypothetical protein
VLPSICTATLLQHLLLTNSTVYLLITSPSHTAKHSPSMVSTAPRAGGTQNLTGKGEKETASFISAFSNSILKMRSFKTLSEKCSVINIYLSFKTFSFFFFLETRFYNVAQVVDLELKILPPWPPECWGYRRGHHTSL